MRKRIIAIVMVITTLLVIVSGCGTENNGTSGNATEDSSAANNEAASNETASNDTADNEAAGAESDAAAAGEEYVLNFWRSSDATDDWYKEKVDEFNEANEGKYQVEMEIVASSGTFSYDDKVSAAVTSDSLPDVMMVDGPYVSTYAKNGLIVSMESYIPAEDKADLMPGALQQNTYNGELYAYSITESSVALYYNKDMIEAAGIEMRIPENPEEALTWEEYEQLAAALTKDDVVGTNIILDKGEGMIYALLPFYVSAGTGMIDETGTVSGGHFNNEAAYEATEFLNSLIQNGYANVDPIDNEFANQKAATMISGSYQLSNAKDWDFEWGVTYYPIAKEGAKAASPNGDWVFTITSSSQNPEAAAAFIQFIGSKENSAENAAVNSKIPARISVMNEAEEWSQYPNSVFKEQLIETSYARPTTPVYATLTSEFSSSLFDVFSGADIQQRLDEAAATIDQEYEEVYK